MASDRLFFTSEARTPLGRLTQAGALADSRGVQRPRVLGSYALVYITGGSGRYTDDAQQLTVTAGDMILVFPEVAHRYGPGAGERWSEVYVVFDGPLFDLWRVAGLLDPAQPVRRCEPVELWARRLALLIGAAHPVGLRERAYEVARFAALLTEMLGAPDAAVPHEPIWLTAACALLAETDAPLSAVAAQLGMAYETFRKRFQQATGVAPARYRAQRRIDAACALLLQSDAPIRSIALELGFTDEYQFSRRFRQLVGMAPRTFRRQPRPAAGTMAAP